MLVRLSHASHSPDAVLSCSKLQSCCTMESISQQAAAVQTLDNCIIALVALLISIEQL